MRIVVALFCCIAVAVFAGVKLVSSFANPGQQAGGEQSPSVVRIQTEAATVDDTEEEILSWYYVYVLSGRMRFEARTNKGRYFDENSGVDVKIQGRRFLVRDETGKVIPYIPQPPSEASPPPSSI